MGVLDQMNLMGEDVRVRRPLFPAKVVLTNGTVRGAEQLLRPKPLQIGLAEPEVTELDNRDTGETAGILLDFGVELHGTLRLLAFVGEGGAPLRVRITLGESAAEAMSDVGVKNATNDHAVRDMEAAVPSYSDQEFGPSGFRFAFIRVLTPQGCLRLKAAVAVCIYRDLPYIGSFRCDDQRLNRIYDVAAYTCHLCMQNLLWDGIKRDRLVWIGDMHPEMLTIRTVFGGVDIVPRSLSFVRDQTPLPGWMNGISSYSLWWLLILRDWYRYTGDRNLLEKQREYVLALLRQVAGCVGGEGEDTLPDHFLDWPTSGTPAAVGGVRGLLALSLDAGEDLAGLYGDEAAAALCRSKAAVLRRRGADPCGSKPALAILSLAGMAPAGPASDGLAAGGAEGMSTFMSYYILTALAKGGRMEDALAILKDYYGGMLDMGATTFWEDFDIRWLDNAAPIDRPVTEGKNDIHGNQGAYCYQGFRHSLCHGWASGPVPFLAERVLGIRIEGDGCSKIRLQPDLGHLEWAEGTFPTPAGVLTVSHTRRPAGSVTTVFDAPDGIKVECG